jgi:hypothetical protein
MKSSLRVVTDDYYHHINNLRPQNIRKKERNGRKGKK